MFRGLYDRRFTPSRLSVDLPARVLIPIDSQIFKCLEMILAEQR